MGKENEGKWKNYKVFDVIKRIGFENVYCFYICQHRIQVRAFVNAEMENPLPWKAFLYLLNDYHFFKKDLVRSWNKFWLDNTLLHEPRTVLSRFRLWRYVTKSTIRWISLSPNLYQLVSFLSIIISLLAPTLSI